MVRTSLLAAVLALDVRRRLERVVRTTHIAARLGYLLLRYSHDLSLSNANGAPLGAPWLMQARSARAAGKKAAYLLKLPPEGKPWLRIWSFLPVSPTP